jgi:formylglycine-generating enzyme required for sulfatase activity
MNIEEGKRVMKRSISSILGLCLLLGASVGQGQWKMQIHMGATVEEHALADIDSVTFHNEDPMPPGMVFVPAGTFIMGSPLDEPGRYTNETQHQVTLTRTIYVSALEVTQSEWQAVMGWNDSAFPGASCPVETVNWYDAVSYCNQRSTSEGLTPAYALADVVYAGHHISSATVTWNQSANGYRLLTESEWEYSCRATSTTAFCNGGITYLGCMPLDPILDQVGWYCGNANDTTHNVGGKNANAWGLKDLHGNVMEWCWDWYDVYPTGPVTDPTGPEVPFWGTRICRGGQWETNAKDCRSAVRPNYGPGSDDWNRGLRLCRTAS